VLSVTCVSSVGRIVDHYERLGVSSTATAMRSALPTVGWRASITRRQGRCLGVRMTQINEAWRVLSDPARRACTTPSRATRPASVVPPVDLRARHRLPAPAQHLDPS